MNIFWLHPDTKLNVQYYCDKHVVKMILEHVQLLSTTNRLCGLDEGYNITHKNHPCAIWTRTSLDNWKTLYNLTQWLHNEYNIRYGKTHSSYLVMKDLSEPDLPKLGITTPPQCMPEKYRGKNLFLAYRNYYIGEKAYMATWKCRDIPHWFNYAGRLFPNH